MISIDNAYLTEVAFQVLAQTCPSWEEWGGENTLEGVIEFIQSRQDRLDEMKKFDDAYTLYAVSLTLAHSNANIDLKSHDRPFLELMSNIKRGYAREARRLIQHEMESSAKWIDDYGWLLGK